MSFDVLCRRCGTKLNSLSGDACPTCEVPLNWERLIPVEDLCCRHCGYCVFRSTGNRCTECGERFSWDEVYEAAIASRAKTFERDWPHKPLASFGRTWLQAAFRPRKLWADLSLFDRPNVAAILIIMAVQWVVFYWGWQVIDEVFGRLMTGISNGLGYAVRFYYPYRPRRAFMPMMSRWYLMTFVAFGFFFYSLRKGGVTWRHMVRLVVYSFTFASMGMFLWGIGEVLMDSTILINYAWTGRVGFRIPARCYEYLGQAMAVLVVVVAWVQFWIAIRRHLGLRHGWIVSALCLVLGQLLAQIALVLSGGPTY